MDKNILIVGADRSGKTTLAKKFVKGCSMIRLDNIISVLSTYPEFCVGDKYVDAES